MKFTFDTLDVGTKIELIKSDDKEETSYPSQILDIVGSNELIVSGPIKQNDLIFMHKGETLKVLYNVENMGIHYFTAEIISRNHSSLYTLKLKKISETKKNQQRRYYRLLSTLKMDKEYIIVKEDSTEKVNEICRASDISGGGMKLYCNYEHEIGDEILCSFKLHDYLIELKATIVRIVAIDSFNYKYALGVSFLDMKEETRDAIIKYIFEQQRILRLKGLI